MRGNVALVVVDDGARNTLDVDLTDAILRALTEAQDQAGAVVVAGRAGCYSVGMDHEVLRSGGEAASDLLHIGTELILRVVECPRPIVMACTGDALEAAAVSMLCYDVRIGAAGDFKIGMDFVSRGAPVPDLAVELARSRLSPRHMVMAVNTSHLYTPDEAIKAGFLDYVTTGDVVEQACEAAADLAERLDPTAFKTTRALTNRSLTDAIIRSAGALWRLKQAAQASAEHPH
jgi:enoyl-CoA hydratase